MKRRLLGTVIDPLFVFLPLLEATMEKMMPMSNLLHVEGYPHYRMLHKMIDHVKLDTICEVNSKLVASKERDGKR